MLSFLSREAERLICAILFLGMTLLGFANVVVRYATSHSLASSEELLTNGFLLLTVFGAAIAARQGQHLAVTAVVSMLTRRAGQAVVVLSAILSVGLLIASAWLSWGALQVLYRNGLTSYALRIPMWYYQVAVPFAFLLIAWRFVQHAVEELREVGSYHV